MIGWYEFFSYSVTNGIRIFVCLFITGTLLKLEKPTKSTVWLSLICGVLTTLLYVFSLPQIIVMAIESSAILFILCRRRRHSRSIPHTIELIRLSRTRAQAPAPGILTIEVRICAFLIICFEIAVTLWDSLLSTGFKLLFQYSTLDGVLDKYMAAIWAVRILMISVVSLLYVQGERAGRLLNRLSSIVVVASMFFVLVLTEQSVVPLPDNQLTEWVILSVILLLAVLFYRINRQYEMEKEIVRLKTEQAELLERDYHALRDIYAANAKLFHDFHNHIDVLHRYLTKDSIREAIEYLEDLRTPIRLITQTVRTGDEAVDYLINSRITLAESRNILVKTNIEFPRQTDIRSVDLVAILGNLWDNSLEAVAAMEGSLRFINLTMRRINDMLVIKMENGCGKAPALIDGEPQTYKEDKALHGWGLKSAHAAAKRYDGTVETEYDNNTFRTVVTLSFRSVSQGHF